MIHDFRGGDSSLEPLIQEYITAQAKLQGLSNPSGTLSDGSGLGEPKFHVNVTSFTGPWGRPQRDGPALRALALIDYGNYLIGQGKLSKVQENIWPLVHNDLSYVGQYWNQTGFDLWEEVDASSFFTTASQYKSLVQGDVFATALGHKCEACTLAPEVLCHLHDYWNGTAVISNIPTNGRTGLDVNSVLASLLTFDSASASCDDTTFQPCSPRALSNHKLLVDSFRDIYGVNKGRTTGQAAAVGRYAEDVYFGGNPWYLATLAAAEQLYDALYQWDKQGRLSVTQISLPFLYDLVTNVTTGTYTKESPEYTKITGAVKAYADGFVSIVQEYTPPDGELNEQFDRNTGAPVSVQHLTWSYAAFLTAVARRSGDVPATWGVASLPPVPSQCARTTVSGTYVTPTPSPW